MFLSCSSEDTWLMVETHCTDMTSNMKAKPQVALELYQLRT